jgi:hypothetical protein
LRVVRTVGARYETQPLTVDAVLIRGRQCDWRRRAVLRDRPGQGVIEEAAIVKPTPIPREPSLA